MAKLGSYNLSKNVNMVTQAVSSKVSSVKGLASKVNKSIINTLGIDLNERFNIDVENDNVVSRNIQNVAFNTEDINDLSDRTIYELIPPKPVYPLTPPTDIEVFACHWSRIYDYAGNTSDTFDFDITSLSDWSIDQWANRHKWPERYGIDPTYLFFEGDRPIFYVEKAISYYDPETDVAITVPDEDIIWKMNGKEVGTGWFFRLGALGVTIDIVQGQAVVVPRTVTCEIRNSRGVVTREFKYAALRPEDTSILETIGVSEPDTFQSTFEGEFQPDYTSRTLSFQSDPRYQPRDVYMRFFWNNYGNGKNKPKRFKGNARVIIDGVTVWTGEARTLHGGRTLLGRFVDNVLVKFFGTIAAISLGPQGVLAGATQALLKQVWNDEGSVNAQASEAFNDYTNFRVTHDGSYSTSGTTNRDSAILYKTPNNDTWNALVPAKLKPGGFQVTVDYEFRFGWRKKKRRRFYTNFKVDVNDWNLDIPYDKPIDLGNFIINYKTDKPG